MQQSTADPVANSYARQAAGIVLRDRGETALALTELRVAVKTAEASGLADRVADVRATMGISLVTAGRTKSGLAELDAAAGEAHGLLLARVLMRRADAFAKLGRYPEALTDLRLAIAGFRSAKDTVWEAWALNNRANIHSARGALTRAEADLGRAEELFRTAGQPLEVAAAVQNRGAIASCRGDIPATLALYDEAARGCAALMVSWPELAFDRCQAYLAAGLTREAVTVVEEALAEAALTPIMRAELLCVGATAALADGEPDAALASSHQARRLFHRQGRDWWEARADLIELRAKYARGERGGRLVASAEQVGERLASLRSDDAPVALLLAGRLAAIRDPDSAHRQLSAAARYRRHTSALVRASRAR
ncbi:MAG: tetratricopeptide repeat protein, partial [Marmoricola sp.]